MAQPKKVHDDSAHDAMRDQEVTEGVDDDKLSSEFPPEEPLGADDYGVTARTEAIEEPIDERVAQREVPDRPESEDVVDVPVIGLVEPDEGTGPDEEEQAVAGMATQGRDPATPSGDVASDDTTMRDTATERVSEVSAEEAAMHETKPPPMGDRVPPEGPGDGYVDEEEAER